MIATIDKAGRIVIPKALRDAMGLKPGTRLDVSYVDGRLEIEYAAPEEDVWEIVMENGFPVLRYIGEGELPPISDEMYRETLEAVRNEGVVGRL